MDTPAADGAGEKDAAQVRASSEDRVLVERLLAGDEAAFGFVVDRYHTRLVRFAMTFVSDRSVAEEVVQDTWLGVIRGLEKFEGRSSLKTWIFRILINRARTRGAREARTISFSALADAADPAVDPARFDSSGRWVEPPGRWDSDTPEEILMRRDAVRRLEEEMARLPGNQRAVLTLRDLEGLDSDEVCNMLAISETNQRVLLHRARSRLRRAMEDVAHGE